MIPTFSADFRVAGTPFNTENLTIDLFMQWTGGDSPAITSVDIYAQILNTQSQHVAQFVANSADRVRLNNDFWGTEGDERERIDQSVADPRLYAGRYNVFPVEVSDLTLNQDYKIASFFVDASLLQPGDQFTIRLLSQNIDSNDELQSVFGAYSNVSTPAGSSPLVAAKTITVVATPEPTTLGLLGLGATAILRLRQRQRSKSSQCESNHS